MAKLKFQLEARCIQASQQFLQLWRGEKNYKREENIETFHHRIFLWGKAVATFRTFSFFLFFFNPLEKKHTSTA